MQQSTIFDIPTLWIYYAVLVWITGLLYITYKERDGRKK